MAYEDPAHVRDNVIKVRLNDIEEDFVRAYARLNQRQPAAFAREMLLLGLQVASKGNEHALAA